MAKPFPTNPGTSISTLLRSTFPEGTPEKFTVRVYDGMSFQKLMGLCDLLQCAPEELFWNPDLDYSGCYYEGDTPDTAIQFEVRRG